jgi:hypothetical protein
MAFIRSEYLPELERVRAIHNQTLQTAKDNSLNRFMKDLAVDRSENPDAALQDRWDPDEVDDNDGDDEDDDGDANIIDRSRCSS